MNGTEPAFRRGQNRSIYSDRPIAPSKPQTQFIIDLLAEIEQLDPETGAARRQELNEQYSNRTLTGGREGTATKAIDALKELRDKLRKEGKQLALVDSDRPDIPEGRYAVDTDEGHTAFYHVSVADNGRIYVRLFQSDQERPLPWKQSLAILKKIEAQGILASSIRFGAEFGVCGVCGRGLTNPESRAAGIGPICAGRLA